MVCPLRERERELWIVPIELSHQLTCHDRINVHNTYQEGRHIEGGEGEEVEFLNCKANILLYLLN